MHYRVEERALVLLCPRAIGRAISLPLSEPSASPRQRTITRHANGSGAYVDSIAAGRFGRVQLAVGGADQFVAGAAIARKSRNAEGGGHPDRRSTVGYRGGSHRDAPH